MASVCWFNLADIIESKLRTYFRDHPLFSAFLLEFREYVRGGGKLNCTLY